MATAQHLLEMGEVGHHGNDVILDIREVKTDVPAGGHVEVLIAAFCEAFDDVGFATEETVERHYFFAGVANSTEDDARVFHSSGEDLIFDCVGFELDFADHRGEGIDNVVARLLRDGEDKGDADTYIRA